MTVLVTGASGAVGSAVVAGLVERGIEVRGTSRTPDTLRLPPRVETFAADFAAPESFAPALRGTERVFLYADAPDPEALMAAVAEAGVRHVVVLSSSAVVAPWAAEDHNGSRMRRVEQAVRDIGVDATFLRPGAFASNAGRWGWSIRSSGTVPLPYPEAVQAPIHERDIADVAVEALSGEALMGAAPILTGPQLLTLREEVEVLAGAIGRPLTVQQQSVEEASAMLARHLPEVWVRQIISDWRRAVDVHPEISDETLRITGHPARSFACWAEDHVGLFA